MKPIIALLLSVCCLNHIFSQNTNNCDLLLLIKEESISIYNFSQKEETEILRKEWFEKVNTDEIFLKDSLLFINLFSSKEWKFSYSAPFDYFENQIAVNLQTLNKTHTKLIHIYKDTLTIKKIEYKIENDKITDTLINFYTIDTNVIRFVGKTILCYQESNKVSKTKIVSKYGNLYKVVDGSWETYKTFSTNPIKSCKVIQGYLYPNLTFNGKKLLFFDATKSNKRSNTIVEQNLITGEQKIISINFIPYAMNFSNNQNYFVFFKGFHYKLYDIENNAIIKLPKCDNIFWLSKLIKE